MFGWPVTDSEPYVLVLKGGWSRSTLYLEKLTKFFPLNWYIFTCYLYFTAWPGLDIQTIILDKSYCPPNFVLTNCKFGLYKGSHKNGKSWKFVSMENTFVMENRFILIAKYISWYWPICIVVQLDKIQKYVYHSSRAQRRQWGVL